MNETIIRIDPRHVYPMHHASGEVFVQVPKSSDSDGDERQRLDQLEKGDQY